MSARYGVWPNWVAEPSLATSAVASDPIQGLLVNQMGGTLLGGRILELIRAARALETLFLVSPLIEDGEALEALIEAQHRGAVVRLLTEVRGRTRNHEYVFKFSDYGFTEAEGERAEGDHLRALGKLCAAHVDVRGFWFNSHAKILILNGQVAIVSSANLATNSLGHGDPSIEIGVEITAPQTLDALSRTFRALWKEAPLALHYLDAGRVRSDSLQSRPNSDIARLSPYADLKGDGVSIVWNIPGIASPLALRLAEALEASREFIVIGSYSFYDLSGLPRLESALLAALRRKVSVTLVVRPGNSEIDPSTRRLVDAGMMMLGLADLHAKVVRVDRSFCLLTSANLNPFSLSDTTANGQASNDPSNLEIGLVGNPEAHLLAPVATWCERLAASATHRWISDCPDHAYRL